MAGHPLENVIQSLFSLAARQLDPEQLANGVVCGLKQDQRKGTQFWPDLRKALCLSKKISESELLTESLQASVVRVSRQYSVLYKKRTRTGGQAKFNAFQQTKFNLPQRSAKKRVAKIDLPNTTPSKIAKFDDKVKTLTYDSLLRDCRQLTSRLKTTEEELIKVRKSNQQLSNENKTLKQKLSTWCPKRANFKLSRSKESTKTWRQKYNSATKKLGSFSQLHEKLTSTERDKKSLKRSVSKTKYKMKKQKEKLIEKRKHENVTKQFEKTVTTLKSKLKKTKDNALYFETQVASSAEDNLDGENCIAPVLIRTKEGNSYTTAMRRAMYKCISCQVPVERVFAVLDHAVRTLTPHQLDDLPSTSTVCRVVREMGVLSDLQVACTLTSSNNSTLAWDATCLDGKHINEVHLATGNGSVVLGISQLPDGRATSYYDNITEIVCDTLETYSK